MKYKKAMKDFEKLSEEEQNEVILNIASKLTGQEVWYWEGIVHKLREYEQFVDSDMEIRKGLLDKIKRLKEENKKLETTLNTWAEVAKDEEKRKYEFMKRNKKAIEYICNTLCDSKAMVRKDISGKEIDNLIHILEGSDKE